MFLSILLFLIFVALCFVFGFLYLNKVLKINSFLYLASFSYTFGICSYVFLCHIYSFIVGPKDSSYFALFTLPALSFLVFICFRKNNLIKKEISIKKLVFILSLALFFSICIFLSGFRYGMFDEAWHIPLVSSIYHNNIYPPRDFFRPDYALLYHFGGDLLAGAISNICRTKILTSFELVSGAFAGITFLSFFSIAWILTNNFRTSLISAICCFFGAGISWLNIIPRFANHPTVTDLIKNILGNIQGTIVDAPSHLSYTSTSSNGYPALLLCLFLTYILLIKNDLKESFICTISILIPLCTLSLFAGWLSLTFILSIFIFSLFYLILKKKDGINKVIYLFLLGLLFFILNKIIGNQMYDANEFLGRANIFNVILKPDPFTLTIWGNSKYNNELTHIISCFSWEFVSAFGFSLILLPVVIAYLIKYKNSFALLLFLCSATTMPLPLVFDFKLNPVDFNRLFGFGNTMLVMLISCGLGLMYPSLFKKKTIIAVYLIVFCFSPLSGFIFGSVFSPQIYLHPHFRQEAFKTLKNSNSIQDLVKNYIKINKMAIKAKNAYLDKFKNEIEFFKNNAKSGDVAISSLAGIPVYAGVYALIPSMTYGLKAQIYSNFDNIHPTIISTLDPYLLSELNVKWVAYDEISKSILKKETRDLLDNKKIFSPVYKSLIMPEPDKEVIYEIFHVEDLSEVLKSIKRNTGWILLNKEGFPLEITAMLYPNISLFSEERDALNYLKQLHSQHHELKNQLITAQPIVIDITRKQIEQSGLNIKLEEKF
ncbi:MAG: hypothetical protein A3B68_06040 [Candidatus Melainabacteria bacterium RIFCSPHIGHO2_02_FULL_34_12]|nr:MAG: hypothetical protein A3B68_06040 [Candidatus Melainabacteria bacterium RIFCSPHIGHO2_02_FULL_34_12]